MTENAQFVGNKSSEFCRSTNAVEFSEKRAKARKDIAGQCEDHLEPNQHAYTVDEMNELEAERGNKTRSEDAL